MEIKRFNEELKTVKYSKLDKWGVDNIMIPKVKIGNKELDLKLGSNVLELFNNHGFDINISQFEWMAKQHLLLPDEINLIEHRVEVGKKRTWDDFLDYNGYEYEKLTKKEQKKIDDEFDNREFINNETEIEFSVFLPENLENVEYAALADASIYLKILYDSELKGVLNGDTDYRILSDESFGFKKFLNFKKIKITNNNIEDIPTIERRLYKDSKVFEIFERELGEQEFNNFFNEWISLIK